MQDSTTGRAIRNRTLIVLTVLGSILLASACQLNADTWIMDDLPNPGRGWTSFHSFNSDDRNNRYPESTVAYYRFTWRALEPVQGEIDFDLIDSLLDRAETEGQTLAFRIMPDCSGCDGEDLGIPQWLIDEGVQGVWFQNDAFMPDFDDPLYLANAERVIRALGARYNGDPRVDHVDIGFVGHWGEWHVSDAEDDGATMPTLENRKNYIDWHLESFPDTPVVMLVGEVGDTGAEALAYAVQNGAGWRADCWGDFGRGWNHMEDYYPQRLAAANVGDAWKTAPVALETCGVPSAWLLLFPRRIDEILQFAVDNHVSILNGKSDSIPRVWIEKFSEFTAQIGYRFELTGAAMPAAVAAGASVEVATTWTNHGNAPVYREYAVTARLVSADDPALTYVFAAPTDIRGWLPGPDWLAAITIAPPIDAPAGAYEVQLGIADPATEVAAVQFLSEFPLATGRWVSLGEIQVE